MAEPVPGSIPPTLLPSPALALVADESSLPLHLAARSFQALATVLRAASPRKRILPGSKRCDASWRKAPQHERYHFLESDHVRLRVHRRSEHGRVVAAPSQALPPQEQVSD